MSATLHRSSAPPTLSVGNAWPALALNAARRMALHPMVAAAFILLLVGWFLSGTVQSSFPDLGSSTHTLQVWMLIPAAATFAAANLISLGPYRHKTDDFEQVLSLPEWQRLAALCLAQLVPALSALILAGGLVIRWMAQPGVVGRLRLAELLCGPAVILLAGLLGIYVSRLSRSVAVGFVVLLALSVFGLAGLLASSSQFRWLTFVAGENPFETPPLPSGLIDRPEWWHLTWLLGVAAVVASLTLRAAASRLWITGTAAGVAVTVLAGVMQLRPMSDDLRSRLEAAHTAPASMQICETRGGVRYCAFPEFRNLISQWATVVDGQRAKAPPAIADQRLFVRQHVPLVTGAQGVLDRLPLERWDEDDSAAGTPQAVPASTRWAAGGSDSFNETEVLGFAAQIATFLVSGSRVPAEGMMACGSRGAVTLWLAASASPGTRDALDSVMSHTTGEGISLSVLNSSTSVHFGAREFALARTMLEHEEAVSDRVKKQWTELTAPATDTLRASQILGVSPPQAEPVAGSGVCP